MTWFLLAQGSKEKNRDLKQCQTKGTLAAGQVATVNGAVLIQTVEQSYGFLKDLSTFED